MNTNENFGKSFIFYYFDFNLTQVNQVKPKGLAKINLKQILRNGDYQGVNNVIEDLSTENFDENEFFDFNQQEGKLVKTYQVLIQYLQYSINHLKNKNNLLNELSGQQMEYNSAAEDILKNQKKKIKELEILNEDYNNNCQSMEFLIKHMNLEHLIIKMGIKNYGNDQDLNNQNIITNQKIKKDAENIISNYEDGNITDEDI